MIEKLVLGTVQMGLDYGVNNHSGKVSLENSLAILSNAIEAGISTLDTAELYGDAHEVIGQFHSIKPENPFKIVTKIPHNVNHEALKEKIENYLITLKINSIETLMFHSFESYVKNKNYLNKLNYFKESGKIEKIGVSIYTNQEFFRVMKDKYIEVVQLPFNLFDNMNLRGELIAQAKEYGKEIHTRSCFLQGLFFLPINSNNKVVSKLRDELLYINQLSIKSGYKIQELALGYCLQQENIDKVIIGVDSLLQLQNNLISSQAFISEKTMNDLNQIKITDLNLLNPSLWNDL
jgi:aryl-alcohol dehydrogenase-like predicted oxidoreductase